METMSNHLPNLDEEKLKFVIELKEKLKGLTPASYRSQSLLVS